MLPVESALTRNPFEEEKLENIFKNYQVMRKNFEELMNEFKSTSHGQERLVTELRKLKE